MTTTNFKTKHEKKLAGRGSLMICFLLFSDQPNPYVDFRSSFNAKPPSSKNLNRNGLLKFTRHKVLTLINKTLTETVILRGWYEKLSLIHFSMRSGSNMNFGLSTNPQPPFRLNMASYISIFLPKEKLLTQFPRWKTCLN